MQIRADVAPELCRILFDFNEGSGEVLVDGWAQMLAALKALLRPFIRPNQDITTKLKRLWAYELKDREGGNMQSVFAFNFFCC